MSEAPVPESEPTKEAEPLEEQLASLHKENENLLNRLKYLQADFENYKKRAAREAEAITKFAHEILLSRVLPVLDELDAAMAHLEGSAADGVRMVREHLLKTFQDAGLQEIPAQGLPFDPYLHDAVDQVADDAAKDGTVREVVRKGYRLHERVLRPAQVVVVKNGDEPHA